MLASSVTAILASGGISTAYAQDDAKELEEITVTGTRIKRDDFNTPTPTTVVDNEYMQNLGIVNVSDAIVQIPSNISVNQPTATANGNFFVGSTIANLRGLNPFFGSRTLTLIDTRRHVPTNQGDGVDMNFIPSVMIDRMEIVTGGASAAYGSGAISGVTNILLNRDLVGGKVELDYGVNEAGDGDSYHVGAAWGMEFGEGRGHWVIGGEYQNSRPVECEDRSWCRESWGVISNNAGGTVPAGRLFNPIVSGQPEFIVTPNVRRNEISNNGVFWAGTSTSTRPSLQVNDAGTGTTTWNDGTYCDGYFAGSCIGGDGKITYRDTQLRSEVERYTAYTTASWELTDRINLFIEGSYGDVESFNPQNSLDSSFLSVPTDNAYVLTIPALAAIAGVGGTHTGTLFPGSTSYFNKDWSGQLPTSNTTTTDVWRIAFGADGQFGDTSWTWDGYFQYGKSDRMQLVDGNRHLSRSDFALDAVLPYNVAGNPGSGLNMTGTPICRVTRDGLSAAQIATGPIRSAILQQLATGCVPVNPFGPNAASAAGLDYMVGYLREDLSYDQMVFSASATGELFEGFGAGAVQLAVGAEYRLESGDNINNSNAGEPLQQYLMNDYLIQYGESFSGDVDVIEGFGELNIPLVRDLPFAEYLEVNAAIRQSHYKNSGKEGTTGETRKNNLTTWKVAGAWDVTDWFRIRGSQSRDARAANFRELYYGQILWAGGAFGYCTNPWTGANAFNRSDPCTWTLAGNVDVKPEKSDTFTIGVVVTGDGAMDGVRFAADYYEIEITDAIQQASIARVWTGCYNGIQEFCDAIDWDIPAAASAPNMTTWQNPPTNTIPCPLECWSNITSTRAESFNATNYFARGVDFTLDYLKPIGDGTLTMRFLASHLIESIVDFGQGAGPVDRAGMSGPNQGFLADFASAPYWQGNLMVTYAQGPWSVTGQGRWTGKGSLYYQYIGPDEAAYATTGSGVLLNDSINDNTVKSHWTFNMSGSYMFHDVFGSDSTVQVFGVINNLFDKDPPIAPTGTGGANPIFFDTMGRAFRGGVRVNF